MSRIHRMGDCLRFRCVAPVLIGLILVGGCARDSDSPDATVGEFEFAEWILSPDPEFIVEGGVVDGEPIVFYRTYRGVITDSGDAAIAGDRRIVILNSQGEIVAGFGRMGEGPGEFRSISLQIYGLTDNRLAIWDDSNRRLSFWSGRELTEEHGFDLPYGQNVIGVFADGVVATTSSLRSYIQAAFQAAIGDPISEVISPGDRQSYQLRTLSGEEVFAFTAGTHSLESPLLTERQTWGDMTVGISAPSCWPWKGHVVINDRIVVADGHTGVISSYERDGTRVEMSHHSPRSAVTQGMIDSLQQVIQQREGIAQGYITEESKRETLNQLGEVGDPLPNLWDAMVADPAGPIWLRRALCFPPDDEHRVWDVIGGDGLPLATLSVPPNLRVLAVRDSRLLGVLVDSLGVERVARFSVVRAMAAQSDAVRRN